MFAVELLGQLGEREPGAYGDALTGDPQRQWQVTAQPRQGGGGVPFRGDPPSPGDAGQQGDRLVGGEDVEVDPPCALTGDQPAQLLRLVTSTGRSASRAAADAPGGSRGVVQHDQHPPAGEPGAVQRGPLRRRHAGIRAGRRPAPAGTAEHDVRLRRLAGSKPRRLT